MTERRNPYLILGLDFGASAEEAAVAFARISRRLRQDDDAPYRIEDATWALHQIEQAETDHKTGVRIYRVPADPVVFRSSAATPEPEPIDRITGPSDEAVDELEAQIVTDVLSPGLQQLKNMGPDLAYGRQPVDRSADRRSADQPQQPAPQTKRSKHLPSDTRHPPAGWYEDPHGGADKARWWDGHQWTEHTQPQSRFMGPGDSSNPPLTRGDT